VPMAEQAGVDHTKAPEVRRPESPSRQNHRQRRRKQAPKPAAPTLDTLRMAETSSGAAAESPSLTPSTDQHHHPPAQAGRPTRSRQRRRRKPRNAGDAAASNVVKPRDTGEPPASDSRTSQQPLDPHAPSWSPDPRGGDQTHPKPRTRKLKRGGPKQTKWWSKLHDVDPITLEPLSELDRPPFQLKSGSSSGSAHYFDGQVLAYYFVASGVFENPMSREAVSVDDCEALDRYMKRHKLGPPWPRVAEAYALAQRRRELAESLRATPGADRSNELRSAAADILLSLFGIQITPSSRPEEPERGDQPARARDPVTIIDDDTAVRSLHHGDFPRTDDARMVAAEDFPGLPEPSQVIRPVPWVQRAAPSSHGTITTRADPHQHVQGRLSVQPQAILERNARFRNALGLQPSSASASRADVLLSEALELSFTDWPVRLLNWARTYSSEVKRIERRLSELINDQRATSVSLKAMPRAQRALVHEFVEFYGLRSESHDAEPRRYVRVIKTSMSSEPVPLLSRAAFSTP